MRQQSRAEPEEEAREQGEPAPLRVEDGRVRAASPRDLDVVAALWLAIGEHHDGLHPLFEMRANPDAEGRELVRALLREPDSAAFVYDVEGRVLGICLVRITHGHRVVRERERAEITDLGVARDYRRRGIGRALAEAALAWLDERGIQHVVVRVAVGNAEGQAFWRALGFGDLMDVLERRL